MGLRLRTSNGADARTRNGSRGRRKPVRRPYASVPPRATNHAISAARFAIFVTIAGWLAFSAITVSNAFFGAAFSLHYALDAIIYIAVVTLLTGSALAYLLARVGYLYRTRTHHRAGRVEIDTFFDRGARSLTVLVPSYCEETDVIRQTLLSAALQEYPGIRIVLLIDDPPHPDDAHRLELLERARALPDELDELLAGPRNRFTEAYENFRARMGSDSQAIASDLRELAAEYDEARAFLEQLAEGDESDHNTAFVRREILLAPAAECEKHAAALRRAADEGARLSPRRLEHLYRRLAWTFQAEFTSFERKQYVSLSHEPNKAMNLNSYLGLMGGRWAEHVDSRGRALHPAGSGSARLTVPDSDYVLTLDADSVLLPEYCLRLIHLLEQPDFERVAVAQTPYSAFPAADRRIERIAGATTDVQHVVHQGLTYYGATFWVGANAVIRKQALNELVETEREHGYPIRRYIKDRTVIEDTESSIDLALKGWELYNYPERLSYSATPPDFGSLCIQRQRWANGGLLIVEKFRRYAAQRKRDSRRNRGLAELFLRLNYLASIAWASIGLIVLLTYPFADQLLSPILLATALPYFIAMSSDLKHCGYKRLDAIRIYSFNLLLLPVNVSGVLKSIGQAIGGQKIAFARTPKVKNRTAAAPTFVIVPWLIFAFSAYTVWHDVHHRNYAHGAYAAFNAAMCLYALLFLVGMGSALGDLWAHLKQWLYRPAHSAAPPVADELDWVTVLYDGAPESALAPVAQETAAAAAAPAVGVDGGTNHAIAAALVEAVREVGDRGRVILRHDGEAYELVVEPAVAES
jgi:cellulose synthase/poly-beta-1,6-N-acetylglucosamine synthase-like glycosyltransferase